MARTIFVIDDEIVTPEKQGLFYNEKFVYMPHCYQVNSNVIPSPSPKNKAYWGLPDDKFNFLSLLIVATTSLGDILSSNNASTPAFAAVRAIFGVVTSISTEQVKLELCFAS